MGLGIFIISVLVVSFVSLCFFKKKFWENRYLVLFISGCVALVATLTTNYATRGKLDTRVETLTSQSIQVMGFDKTIVDTNTFILNRELDFDKEYLRASDSTKIPIYSHHLFYYNSDDKLCVGYATGDDLKAKTWESIYIVPSDSDTVAYFGKVRQYYADRDSKWIADISLPYIKTIKCLYLPPAEYAMIPDSLIRELPFKL